MSDAKSSYTYSCSKEMNTNIAHTRLTEEDFKSTK